MFVLSGNKIIKMLTASPGSAQNLMSNYEAFKVPEPLQSVQFTSKMLLLHQGKGAHTHYRGSLNIPSQK